MSCDESSISPRCSHARTAPHAWSAFTVAPASMHHLMFGALVANSNASGRIARSQSGCLSCGSLLTTEQRQSATRLRLVSRPSFGGQRSVECRGKPPHGYRAVVAGATTARPRRVGRGKEWLQNTNTTSSQGERGHALAKHQRNSAGRRVLASPGICHQPNWALQPTLTHRIASAPPYGRG